MAWLTSTALSALVTALWKSASCLLVPVTVVPAPATPTPGPSPLLLFCCKLFSEASSHLQTDSWKTIIISLRVLDKSLFSHPVV